MTPTIAILNRTTILDDAAFHPVVSALQKQVSGDFAPLWRRDASLVHVAKSETPPPGAWQVVVSDTIAMAGALGYHDFTHAGLPISKVAAKTHGKWTVTLSHEVLEMLGDPDIVRAAFIQTSPFRALVYAYENCDPVEDDRFGYDIDGVTLSDFVTEEWFEPGRFGVKFSFRDTVKRPLTLAPGGYISVYRTPGIGRWIQVTAREDTYAVHEGNVSEITRMYAGEQHGSYTNLYRNLPNVGSRRERRNRSRIEWMRSDTP
jgi:hypothetical protein